jgi:ferritin-like metal-binding protein YciE
MKAASSASLQLGAAVLAIVGTIGGTAWGGANWLNGKFEAQDAKITTMAREHGQREADLRQKMDSQAAATQRQIDQLSAALKAMNVAQPKPTRELVRDLMVTKGISQAEMSRRPGYDKGISASATAVKK